jgi:carbohydrate kinase (thermoresistant glucokinase family)
VTPAKIVVIGVSGCGKSTLGRALAELLGWRFVEGDFLHPPANITKMSAGIALDDEDRWPFLENVSRVLNAIPGEGIVVACSALKRSYRNFLRARTADLLFVLPVLDRDQLASRMLQRKGHFMPATLLDSQLKAFEMPGANEPAIVVDGASAVEHQVAQALSGIAEREKGGRGKTWCD